MTILGASAISSMYRIQLQEEKIRNEYVERSRAIENLRSNIYLSGTRLREYLLEPADQFADARRAQYENTRRLIEAESQDYERHVTPETRDAFHQLTQELDTYFSALAQPLGWDAAQRRAQGYDFIEKQVLPRRTEVLGLADRLETMTERDLELGSEAVAQTISAIRARLIALLITTLIIGVMVAGISLWRLLRLESESQARFEEVLRTQEELKKLSVELRSAQETERRRISRELHDEVGQMLSAISLTLANVRSAIKAGHTEEAFEHLRQVQDMAERNLGMVRNIALLLRPTMLDDLGLLPALRWLAREVSRTTDVNTDVVAESFADDLPEEHRTCVFRVVQEAVRNAARHSGARHIRIYLRQQPSGISASVQDDGKGFDPREEKGLGMVGMEERALHLGGSLRVTSERGRGTIVLLILPLSGELKQSQDAPQPEAHAQIRPLRTA